MGRLSLLETAIWASTAAVALAIAVWSATSPGSLPGVPSADAPVAAPTERLWPVLAAALLAAVSVAVLIGSIHVP
ncbi:MAG TPA: hypothetical protein VEC57_00480 [Candidatus Limnocylindrales bacterium]|nr:hypothetical protein [Candidatus Limnocylindrales bacterium]